MSRRSRPRAAAAPPCTLVRQFRLARSCQPWRRARALVRLWLAGLPASHTCACRDSRASADSKTVPVGPCRYVDRTSYLKTQPLEGRKKGFGSSDAKKRDEFSNDMETSKWRERIKGEMEVRERSYVPPSVAAARRAQNRASLVIASLTCVPSCSAPLSSPRCLRSVPRATCLKRICR